ncbi:MAG: hypothetical protein Q9216_004578 [Gyalolechia sp. 2 TL-2023]
MGQSGAPEEFRRRFEALKVSDAERHALIEELIDQNDKLRQDCRQMSLDLDNEKGGRRRLQNRIHDELEPLTSRRQFVLVLIDADGDGYIFREVFLNKSEEGGRNAADELLARVKHYLKGLGLDINNTDVVIRAYANLRGLGRACVKNGSMKATADLSLFANGFTGRQPLFDFVDVGLGKERADHKVKEVFNFFVTIPQCKHVVLGVSHDSGYAPFLERFAADKSISDRITLLEGYQVSPSFRNLGFTKVVKFPSVFAIAPSSTNQNVPAQSQPGPSQINQVAKGPSWSAAVDSGWLGPVLTTDEGQRLDRPLTVDKSVVQAIQKKNLCHWLFLKGHCEGCKRNHAHPLLSVEQQDALWVLARQGRCYTHQKVVALHEKCPFNGGDYGYVGAFTTSTGGQVVIRDTERVVHGGKDL